MSSQGNDRARDCSIARTSAGADMEGGSAGKHLRSDLWCGGTSSDTFSLEDLLYFMNHSFSDLFIVLYWLCLFINICYTNT